MGKFKQLQAKLEAKGNSPAKAAAIAAYAGRKKYGAKNFNRAAAKGVSPKMKGK
jgi:hypothetical protein